MDEGLGVRRDGSVLVLTLNRPDVRNALDTDLVHRLLDTLSQARRDQDVSAVVLTGAPPVFCAGGDLADVPGDADAATLAVRHRVFVELAQAVGSLPKPVVAAVDGVAVGAGASLTLTCDHLVMAPDALLQLSFLAVGLPPDLLSVSLLRARAGSAVAADLLYSGRAVAAEEAVRLHLASEIATNSDIVARAVDTGRRLASLPPFAFATTKSLLRHAATLGDALVDVEPFAVGAAAASGSVSDLVGDGVIVCQW